MTGSNASNVLVDPLTLWWHVFDSQYLRHSLGWTVALVIAYSLVLIIGTVGNLLVILVVIFRPPMRTVTNLFIMNLAVADLLVVVFCVPGTLFANLFAPWILGWFMCKAVVYVQGVSICASAYSLAAISLDRCKAIICPHERRRGLSKRQAVFTICLIWIVALLLTLPWAMVFKVVRNDEVGMFFCMEAWENAEHGKLYYLVVNLLLCYSIPLLLISLSNVAIWCHVSHRKIPQDTACTIVIKQMHRHTRNGVRKTLGIVTLAFLLSWLPLYILVSRVRFSEVSEWESDLIDSIMPIAQWLGSCNSCVNPVLYAFLNAKFREMFKSLLPSWPLCRRDNVTVGHAKFCSSFKNCKSVGSPFRFQRSGGPHVPKNAENLHSVCDHRSSTSSATDMTANGVQDNNGCWATTTTRLTTKTNQGQPKTEL